ncbi:Golgin subfamily A member 7/ERF4 family-domain-containing protein, partial [Pseudomassariella vexata]
RRPAAARLWNPTNSTPRPPPSRLTRRRQRSTPPPPAVLLEHPAIDVSSDPPDPTGVVAGNYPLLSLPEQRQNRHSASTSANLQIEGRRSGDQKVSLPRTLRYSYDGKRLAQALQLQDTGAGQSVSNRARALSFGLVRPEKSTKGKGKAVMALPEDEEPGKSFSKDLERGPNDHEYRHSRDNMSLPEDIGSAISSSNSSIMGDPDQPDIGEEWGPQHPCFPHLNPHVSMDSPEYTSTRIIRIRRDWLIDGDLAPTFSNLYPEILDPAGITEQEFRRIIEKLNGELILIFNPYYWRNILDGALGLLTGWIWDDIGFTNAKTRLRNLESWIEKWNTQMEKTFVPEEGIAAPKIIPLRRSGYMTLDIQIPDPEIAPAAASEPGVSRSGPEQADPASQHDDGSVH